MGVNVSGDCWPLLLLDQKAMGMSMKIQKSTVDDVLNKIKMHEKKVMDEKMKQTGDAAGTIT